MITFSHRGDLKKTSNFLEKAKRLKVISILEKYANMGIEALSMATPIDSGLTSISWSAVVKADGENYTIKWSNSNVVDGVPVVILLQYGHGTGNGGYVQGRDFINPAILPILDRIVEDIWKEVTRL